MKGVGFEAMAEPIVDHRSAAGARVVQVRGTLLVSSLQALREYGYFERYLANLPAPQHDEILFCVANSWLPVELAMSHYGACDAMGLSDRELEAVGEAVSQRIMGTFLGTMLRSGRSVGATPSPWIPLRQYGRICDRLLEGGHHRVTEVGPKDALVETSGVPMFRFRYFRTATLGIMRGAAGMFAKTCFAKETGHSDAERIQVSLRWV
jgi:hypothetical protein